MNQSILCTDPLHHADADADTDTDTDTGVPQSRR
jgi:hypothetical protein